MSRNSFAGVARKMARAAAQAERAHQAAIKRQIALQMKGAKQAAMRAKADAKDARSAFFQARIEETEELNREVADRIEAIETVLARALSKEALLKFSDLGLKFVPDPVPTPTFVPTEPKPSDYLLAAASFWQRILPGGLRRHAERSKRAEEALARAMATYKQQMSQIKMSRTLSCKLKRSGEERLIRTMRNWLRLPKDMLTTSMRRSFGIIKIS
jgi:hypothetical protein